MSDNSPTKISEEALKRVRFHKEKGELGRAFAHYLVYLEFCSQQRAHCRDDFMGIFLSWIGTLESTDRPNDALNCFKSALHYYPGDFELLSAFSTFLIRNGEMEGAVPILKAALRSNPNDLHIEKNLHAVQENLIPRWHFRMLNDRVRNEAYATAISQTISKFYNKVLDIGSGCGLLSLYASRNEHVTSICALEHCKVLSEISEDIFKANKVTKINVIGKNSTELSSKQFGKFNVLVTEIFDTALFGEVALTTLVHAWDNLLMSHSKIVPDRAVLFVTPFSSEELFKKHVFNPKESPLTHEGSSLVNGAKEPYDAEFLRDYAVEYLTKPKDLEFDFKDVEMLRKVLNDSEALEPFQLEFLGDGKMHGFAIWFDLHLTDDIIISTNPFKNGIECWEQAIVFLDEEIPVSIGQKLTARVSFVNNALSVKIVNSDGKSADFTEATRKEVVPEKIFSVLTNSSINDCLQKVSSTLKNKSINVYDANHFPTFGLMMAKENALVYWPAGSDEDVAYVEHLVSINNIKQGRFNSIVPEEVQSFFRADVKFDVIVLRPILEQEGLTNGLQNMHFPFYQGLLKPEGVFLPRSVVVYVMAVESEFLKNSSRVNDENLLGFKMAEVFNEYSVPEVYCLDSTKFPYERLTEAVPTVELLQDTTEEVLEEVSLPIRRAGNLTGFLYWFRMDFIDGVTLDTCDNSNFKVATCLCSEENFVECGRTISVIVKLHKGLLKVYRKL